jgi:hypothetical protein
MLVYISLLYLVYIQNRDDLLQRRVVRLVDIIPLTLLSGGSISWRDEEVNVPGMGCDSISHCIVSCGLNTCGIYPCERPRRRWPDSIDVCPQIKLGEGGGIDLADGVEL